MTTLSGYFTVRGFIQRAFGRHMAVFFPVNDAQEE